MTSKFVKKVLDSEIGLRPILPLGQPLDIGHVATVGEDGLIRHRGTISSMLGLNSIGRELPPVKSRISVSVTSGRDVKVNFGASAKTDGVLAQFGDIKAKASIEFGSTDSFFVALSGIRIRQLEEPQLLLNAILQAYEQRPRRWQKEWVFVDRIGIASSLTIVLARESATTVLLKASATARVARAAEADLASGFSFVASNKGVTQITGQRDVAAFYSAYRVRDGLFSEPQIDRFYKAVAFGTDLDLYPPDARPTITAKRAFESA